MQLLDSVFKYHGLPTSISSDRDRRLMSKIWQATLQHLGIIHKKTMSFYPQRNGLAEHANQSVVHLMRVLAHEGRLWVSSLPVVEMVINDAPTLGHYSPFYLNLGYHPVMPRDWPSTLKQEMLEEPSGW